MKPLNFLHRLNQKVVNFNHISVLDIITLLEKLNNLTVISCRAKPKNDLIFIFKQCNWDNVLQYYYYLMITSNTLDFYELYYYLQVKNPGNSLDSVD